MKAGDVPGDNLGAMERHWVCAGFLTLPCGGLEEPLVLWPEEGPPCLLLPADWPPRLRELAYGWARSECYMQRRGWYGALRGLLALTADIAA